MVGEALGWVAAEEARAGESDAEGLCVRSWEANVGADAHSTLCVPLGSPGGLCFLVGQYSCRNAGCGVVLHPGSTIAKEHARALCGF